MPTLYKDTGYSLTHLVEDIKHGNIALPDIQRPFVWSSAKIRDLFDSMYRGYPVGTLMFWETGAEVGTRQIGGGNNENVARSLVVDGQQRLTALFAILTGSQILTNKFETKRIQISFSPIEEIFEVADAAIKRDPEYIPDITALWKDSYKSEVRSYMQRLGDAKGEQLDHSVQDRLEDKIDRVRDLRDFRFQVIELNSNADEEQVAEIFVRINSEGVKLNQADFILTLMSVHWEQGRRQLEKFCREAVDPTTEGASPKNPFIDPRPDQILRAAVGLAFRRGQLKHVYSILRGKDLETGDVSSDRRVEQFEALKKAQDEVVDLSNWFEFLKCLTQAGFRSRKMITSENAVIYTYTLWLVGRRDFNLEFKPLRSVIARWFFMAHTTGRYTSSPESQIESDLARISTIEGGNSSAFCAELDRIVKANFTGDYWKISLPNRLDSSSARSPVLYAYWAALNLHDAELLFSSLRIREMLDPSVSSPRSIERHHLFPKAYLKSKGITARRQINAIANMAFLDWPENADIGSKAPSEYLPGLAEKIDAERLKKQNYWHALPVGWEQLDYADFLEKRRILIAEVIKSGFERLWDESESTATPMSLSDTLAIGESQTLEFKSSARWNIRANKADKKMEDIVTKTVCGFLNTEGGTLVIGVDDEGNPLGIDDDLKTFGAKNNQDGYELWLHQHLSNNLSIQTTGLIKVRFEEINSKTVCVVVVAASGKAAFAKSHGGQSANEFWVRVGNSTKQLHGDDMLEYQKDHWG